MDTPRTKKRKKSVMSDKKSLFHTGVGCFFLFVGLKKKSVIFWLIEKSSDWRKKTKSREC